MGNCQGISRSRSRDISGGLGKQTPSVVRVPGCQPWFVGLDNGSVSQVPALNIFEGSYKKGKFDASRKLSNGGLLEFAHIYPMDAVYDTADGVPDDVSSS